MDNESPDLASLALSLDSTGTGKPSPFSPFTQRIFIALARTERAMAESQTRRLRLRQQDHHIVCFRDANHALYSRDTRPIVKIRIVWYSTGVWHRNTDNRVYVYLLVGDGPSVIRLAMLTAPYNDPRGFDPRGFLVWSKHSHAKKPLSCVMHVDFKTQISINVSQLYLLIRHAWGLHRYRFSGGLSSGRYWVYLLVDRLHRVGLLNRAQLNHASTLLRFHYTPTHYADVRMTVGRHLSRTAWYRMWRTGPQFPRPVAPLPIPAIGPEGPEIGLADNISLVQDYLNSVNLAEYIDTNNRFLNENNDNSDILLDDNEPNEDQAADHDMGETGSYDTVNHGDLDMDHAMEDDVDHDQVEQDEDEEIVVDDDDEEEDEEGSDGSDESDESDYEDENFTDDEEVGRASHHRPYLPSLH